MGDWKAKEKEQMEQYINYLHSLKVGNNVYPCYDSKTSRCTKCIVKEVTDDCIIVEGLLWGCNEYPHQTLITTFSKNTGECYTNYGEEEPTFTDLIKKYVCPNNDIGEEDENVPDGDYYILKDIESCVKDKFFNKYYKELLHRLGLKTVIKEH